MLAGESISEIFLPKNPPTSRAEYQDAIHIIANALKVSGADRSKLRDAIENTKNYVGVIGVRNYSATDHEGVNKDCFAFYVIKDKKFSYIKDIK